MERTRTALADMASLLLRGVTEDEAVVTVWPLICGSRVASRTRALNFSRGQLTVEVPDASWRSELAGYMPHYLNQLRKTSGVAVERMRFTLPHESDL